MEEFRPASRSGQANHDRNGVSMVTIELDPARERHLDELARSQGEDAALLAQRILSDYLDFFALPETEDDDAWAEASVKMAAAAFDAEDWNAEDQKP